MDVEGLDETTSFIGKEMEGSCKVHNEEEEDLSRNIDDNTTGKVFFYTLVMLMESLAIVCIILVVVWTKVYLGGFAWDGSGKEFNYHPLFMVIGFIVLYGNAAVSYRVFRTQSKFKVKLLHGGIQSGVLLFAVLGLMAVFDFHNVNKIPNVYSLHSWVGIFTVVLFAAQLLLGFLGFLYPKFSDENRALYLKFHVFFGVVIFAMGIVACVSGITEKMLFSFKETYSLFQHPGLVANSLGAFIIMFATVVAYILYDPTFKRVPTHHPIN